jgi:hypothetical protein
MLIVDPPAAWGANKDTAAATAKAGLSALGLNGVEARNAALYFPRVIQSDPKLNDQLDTFVPCGIVAGVMARTDTQRGVWKAPAGLDASVNGVMGLQVNLNDDENGMLNPLGINCLRFFPASGRVVWGSRTLRGADQLADEYKYVPVRRLALFIEESLYRGTQWVVFEPASFARVHFKAPRRVMHTSSNATRKQPRRTTSISASSTSSSASRRSNRRSLSSSSSSRSPGKSKPRN